MKFSYNWLQTYFKEPLPEVATLADKITFHSSEIEEVITLDSDTVLDIKVLPDKSAWLMSHRGLAKEVSAMLQVPMLKDPFLEESNLDTTEAISVEINDSRCDFYSAALIKNIKVTDSPAWLKDRLQVLDQRSINNIVDATNFVMFDLGQPLHAFDADKLTQENGQYKIEIRAAKAGEEITVLTGETYTLCESDMVIVDGVSGNLLGIAGVKGGQIAAVDQNTKNIILESAHFDRIAVRKTARRLKLLTDASKRFENGISRQVAPVALKATVHEVIDLAGGELVGANYVGQAAEARNEIIVTLEKVNSVLGLNLSFSEVETILKSLNFASFSVSESEIKVTPGFERDDLVLAEDLIEEIGRMHGLHHIESIVPETEPVKSLNKRFYYAEKIRKTLIKLNFSEVYTSSFRNKDIVKLENALASDKQYLRSTLVENLKEVRQVNIAHKDLLGMNAVKIFEIGTTFSEKEEDFKVAIAVQSNTTYKAKTDDSLLNEALTALNETLNTEIKPTYHHDGVCEFSLDETLTDLPEVSAYEPVEMIGENQYQPFSVFPAMTRDVSMWVPEGTGLEVINELLTKNAGPECVLINHLDTFTKEGRTSYAFRLVFQSMERTLTDTEVQVVMDKIYQEIAKAGFEAR